MTTREPVSGAIQHNASLVGPRRYGAALGTAATSGILPKEGYRQRSRDNLVRQKIQARLAMLNGKGQV